jgi:hypothetical protein
MAASSRRQARRGNCLSPNPAKESAMRQQMMWFAFFVALMFLLPPLVALDLAVP